MLDNLLGTSHLKDEDTLKKQIQEYEENKRKKHFWQKQQESPDLFEYDSLGKFKDILDKTNKFYESRKIRSKMLIGQQKMTESFKMKLSQTFREG